MWKFVFAYVAVSRRILAGLKALGAAALPDTASHTDGDSKLLNVLRCSGFWAWSMVDVVAPQSRIRQVLQKWESASAHMTRRCLA